MSSNEQADLYLLKAVVVGIIVLALLGLAYAMLSGDPIPGVRR